MEKFEIQAISAQTIAEVARFLHRWRSKVNSNAPVEGTFPQDCQSLKKHLHWLLLENPLAASSPQHGFCVRNTSGVIVGIILCFPNAFVVDDSRLLGLCSGSFFVEPSARMQGFYLFKKYLNDSSCDFYFGTTCNANSGALWKKIGGSPVPQSDKTYILPVNFAAVLPGFVAGKTSSKLAIRAARAFGFLATELTKLAGGRARDFVVEPCRDWQKLSDIFLRHRPPGCITAYRSPEFLKWRYGPGSPNSDAETCWFRDKRGNEGWFAIAEKFGGRTGQMRGALLLDAVWPQDKIEFKQLLPVLLRRPMVRTADAVFFHQRLGVNYRQSSALIIPRTLPAPQAFQITRKGLPPIDVSKLDLVPADGDSAWN